MTPNEFIKGAIVQFFDEDDRKWVYGEVVTFDNTMNKVFIEWDDLLEPCWHGEDDFVNIKKKL